jgi:CRP-like cAMP-binding protein
MESLCARHPALRSLIFRYLHGLMTQLSQSAVCNRFHTTDQRLARWLLISQDRVQSEVFAWTQEFLSQMLGADRASVTLAVGAPREAGPISTARGQITVLNRKKLGAQACECYQIVRDEFDEFLGKS